MRRESLVFWIVDEGGEAIAIVACGDDVWADMLMRERYDGWIMIPVEDSGDRRKLERFEAIDVCSRVS